VSQEEDRQPQPPEQEPVSPSERLDELRGFFLDIARCSDKINLQPETVDYIRHGGSLRLCLSEILSLTDPCETDQKLADARENFMEAVLERSPVLPKRRKQHEARVGSLQADYIDSILAKVEKLIDSTSGEEALALGQMPTLVEQASFGDDKTIAEEDLAGNHFYLLMDTALKEHAQRRLTIDERRASSHHAKLIGNRVVHVAVAASVFATSLLPHLGILPIEGGEAGQDINLGLQILSGIVLGVDTPEVIRLRYLDRRHKHHAKALHEQLAYDQHLSDLALRIVYNSTRCEGSSAFKSVTGRSGTRDTAENLRRFALLDTEFAHLNNDPGGKPYTGDQSLSYAARLLIERPEQRGEIIAHNGDAKTQKDLFLQIAREILAEDVQRMKKGLSGRHLQHGVLSAVGMLPAILDPHLAADLSDSSTLGRDASGILHSRRQAYESDDDA
jgi:hypothetical protein